MGNVLMPGGGTPVDLDIITAGASQILSGYKSVDQNGDEVDGSILSIPAQTIVPTTANQTIPAGKYTAGAITIAGSANLIASCIKKGVSLFGVVGTWEGYVAGDTDIYYMSDFSKLNSPINGTYQYLTYETAQITIVRASGGGMCYIPTNRAFNLTGLSKVIVEGANMETNGSYPFKLYGSTSVITSTAGLGTELASAASNGSSATLTFGTQNITRYLAIGVPIYTRSGAIYRIRFE